MSVGHPKLWSPASPNLYDASIFVRSGGALLQKYTLRTGVRSIKVVGGSLFLNGAPMNFRGVFVHEDSIDKGFAIDNKTRDQELAWTKELGATVIRSHYPLSPYTSERMDELGLMQWSEIPVYSIKTKYLKQKLVRQLAARELESNINVNGNHPSVIVWSIGNELSARPGPVQGAYIADAVAPRQGAGPDAPRRPRRRRLPVGGLPARVRAARRRRHQRLLRLVPGPERADRRPLGALGLPRRRAHSAIRTRRSSSRSSARRPTATGRWRRRAPTSSSRTS